MSAYLTRTQVEMRIPAAFVRQALDDDGDGVEDPGIWDEVATSATRRVNALIAPAVTTPVDDPPDLLVEASIVFACEMLYLRRGFSNERNPFTGDAEKYVAKLEKIGSGEDAMNRSGQKAPSLSDPTRNFDSDAQDGI